VSLLRDMGLNFFAARARQPCERMIFATRCLPTGVPSLFNRLVIRSAPARDFSSSKMNLILIAN
jgi:hypothetical protein